MSVSEKDSVKKIVPHITELYPLKQYFLTFFSRLEMRSWASTDSSLRRMYGISHQYTIQW